MLPFSVWTPDQLTIAAAEWGNPNGREIVFIHGYMQSSLSWLRQLTDSGLAEHFRMIVYDLRGHGASEKPVDKENYAHDRLWADELAAVMAAAGLKRPVLVAWSYGGRVVADFVRHYGAGSIAGVNFVGAVTKSGSDFTGPDMRHVSGTLSSDLAVNIAATRAVLRACFYRQPTAEDFETMLAFNMVSPPTIRAGILGRTANPGDTLAKMDVPVLVTQGSEDRFVLPAFGEFTAAQAPNARLSLYRGVGHAPFWEDPARFNRELAEFAGAAHGLMFELESHVGHGAQAQRFLH